MLPRSLRCPPPESSRYSRPLGSPVFSGATGNVATEVLVNFFEEMRVATGGDLDEARAGSRLIQDFLNRPLPSYILRAGATSEPFARAREAGQVA